MKRRELIFDNFSQAQDDIHHLHLTGYTRLGNWTLGQMCEHLAKSMNAIIDGYGYVAAWPVRVVACAVLPFIFWTKRVPSGAKIPKRFEPAPDIGDEEGVRQFNDAIERFEHHKGQLAPHPYLGKLSRDQWRRLQLIHCAHHLGFLIPDACR